jgi:tripeptidyl-peptidase-1
MEELSKTEDIADVHSISYANSENEMSPFEIQIFNYEVCKLGLRGKTVIVSSGDYGAPGIVGCKRPSKQCTINPLFPASSPYVTTVGGTMGPEIGAEEVASSIKNGASFTSGGGFSNLDPRPRYQNRVVKKFLSSYNNVKTKRFTSWGRAYPDVSFLSNNYGIYINGVKNLISGTSTSAPAFASLVTLANSLRKEAGKPPLGFLNYLLYHKSMKDSYVDITEGSNECCTSNQGLCCPGRGWEASVGWDPVSGLGRLDAEKFLNVVLSDLTPEHNQQPIP